MEEVRITSSYNIMIVAGCLFAASIALFCVCSIVGYFYLSIAGPSIINLDSLDPDEPTYDEIKDPPVFSGGRHSINPV
ncbi:hypothetical protein PFISCL1PPCAC_28865 [Pristionchus fissidentatus]|uniref:Uncharacterized protein n=1 Tax=Pristionchus fissidentatus TaxID=1538716 RepID=A0AAV5WEX1_9BILA|nr:hypothetical protein PFISCL1PPCAC_20561 [Pristionchus fissidentatus]GMT37568.1 hypothetical protein PFISCL1PPCAC_28865 [Pristionchus fissidentatus]